MLTFCTLSDENFVPHVLVLHDNLQQYLNNNFKLYYLCLDDKTFNAAKTRKNIIPIHINQIENQKDFQKLLKVSPSAEAVNVGRQKNINPQRMQALWGAASYFTYYIMLEYEPEHVIYLDSDIYFFDSPQKIVDAMQEKSIGIFRNNAPDNNNGEFNVSVVYFKNDLAGNQCLWSWRNWLLDSNNQYYKTHGQCGDQKYLDLFIPLFGKENVVVLDDKGLLQAAPWSIEVLPRNLKEEAEQILFYHFSDLRIFPNGDYLPAPRHGINSKEQLRKIEPKYSSHLIRYDRYVEKLLKVKQ